MGVAEANESQRPAEPELTLQRDGVRLATERKSRLATGTESEAKDTAGMDDGLVHITRQATGLQLAKTTQPATRINSFQAIELNRRTLSNDTVEKYCANV